MAEHALKEYPTAVVLAGAMFPRGQFLSDEQIGRRDHLARFLGASEVPYVRSVEQPSRIQVTIHGGNIIIAGDGTPPEWVQSAANKCQQISALRNNWDGYGAGRFEAEVIAAALEFLSFVMTPELPTPDITPTAGGQVQVEWHADGYDIEVRVSGSGRYELFAADLESGDETELPCTSDTRPIKNLLGKLSARRGRRAATPHR